MSTVRSAFLPALTACLVLLACRMATAQDDVVVVAEAAEAVDIAVDDLEGLAMMQLQADPKFSRLQMHLGVEKALIRRVCNLRDEQEIELKKFDDKWLTQAMKVKPADAVKPGLIGAFFGARQRRGQQPATVNVAQVRKTLDKALLDELDEEQQAAYVREKKQRDEFRNNATAAALVESLQERLDLSGDQRAEIKKRLSPWVASHDLIVMHYFSGNNYYPKIPEHYLDSLSDEQKEVYGSLQKHLFTAESIHNGNAPIVIKK